MNDRRLSYDQIARDGMRFRGWQFDELADAMLRETTDGRCEQCAIGGDCLHNAVRALVAWRRGVLAGDTSSPYHRGA